MSHKNSIHFVLILTVIITNSKSLMTQIREPNIFPFPQDNSILFKTAGVYNFDNDDYFDIVGIASRIDRKGNKIARSTYLVHLESSASGDLNVMWKFGIPDNLNGDFTDITVCDIDGDGQPEISAIINISEIISGESPGSLYIFKYSDGFTKEPTTVVSLTNILSARPRPIYIDSGDMNGDGKSDLVVSSVGPGRGLSIVEFEGPSSIETPRILFQSSELKVLLGILQYRAISASLDTFPGEDLMIFGGKKNLEVEVYRFDFRNPPIFTYTLKEINRSDVDLSKIVWGDLDGDELDEILVPLKSGGAYLLYIEDNKLKARILFPKEIKLSTVAIMDLNSNGREEILFQQPVRPEINEFEFNVAGSISDLSSYKTHSYSDPLISDIRYLNIVPVLSASNKNVGSIVVPYFNPNLTRHGLFFWLIKDIYPLSDLGIVNEVLDEIDITLAKKDTLSKLQKVKLYSEADLLFSQFQGLEGEEVALASLPKRGGIPSTEQSKEMFKPDLVVHVGEALQYVISLAGLTLSDTSNLNMNIKMPDGMKFDLTNCFFTWVPADTQLGLHKINAQFTWGSKKVTQSFTVYVNDPPKITSTLPVRDIIQIGGTFRTQIEVIDRNKDAQLIFKLIDSPDGANIGPDGEILWKPSFNQADWYDFAVGVSDGFDFDRIDFALFVNHPVSIESVAPNIIAVKKPYTYTPLIKDNNKGFYVPWYSVSPRITDWKKTGIYETAILDDTVRGNLSKLIVRYKKTYLAEPSANETEIQPSRAEPDSIPDVFEDQNKLVFVFRKDMDKEPTAAEIINTFFNNLNMSIPKYASPVRRHWYTYTLKESPRGMKMNNQGVIEWTPAQDQFDFQSLSYTVSDGYFSAEENAQIYVNYPPTIISTPDSIANVNSLWQYEIKVTDLNTDAKLTYELIKALDGMVISPQGVVSWSPTELQINRHIFSVRVSDGMAKDIQKAVVFVNVKPRILSVPKPVALTGLKYEYLLEAEDPNGDAMVYKAVRLPKSATFDPGSHIFVWMPKKNQKGVNDVVFDVVDSHGGSTPQEFQIHVFQNPSGKKFSFFWSGISIVALIGVIYLIALK